MSHSLPDLWPGWRQDRQQVEWGHAEERTGVGDRSGSPGASDRCERQFSSSKLLRTEAENKHLGFRDDIPRYQPLANSSTYIRGQDTAVFRLWCRLAVGAAQRTRGETREVNIQRSRPSKNSSQLRMATSSKEHWSIFMWEYLKVASHFSICSLSVALSSNQTGSYWWCKSWKTV